MSNSKNNLNSSILDDEKPDHSKWQSFWIWGLGQTKTSNPNIVCKNKGGVAAVETRQSFFWWFPYQCNLWNLFSKGLWTGKPPIGYQKAPIASGLISA